MELCSNGHDEVCYETRECPACLLKDEMQEKIDRLQEDNDRLMVELDDMQAIMDAEEAERA